MKKKKGQWPIDQIVAAADKPARKLDKAEFTEALATAGYGIALIGFLFGLYEKAGGCTFYDSAYRIHPFRGDSRHHLPTLVEWNDLEGWKRLAPAKAQNIFYFCSNAFGDQFGMALDAKKDLANENLAVLWVEKYRFESATASWPEAMAALVTNDEAVGSYLARLKEVAWASEKLGMPAPYECYSSKVPVALGGGKTLDDIEIKPMALHVDFTLQVLSQARKANS